MSQVFPGKAHLNVISRLGSSWIMKGLYTWASKLCWYQVWSSWFSGKSYFLQRPRRVRWVSLFLIHCLLGLSLLAGPGFTMGSIPIWHSTGHGCQTPAQLLKPRSGSWRPTQGLSADTTSEPSFYSAFVFSFRFGSQRAPVLSGKLSYVYKKICVILPTDFIARQFSIMWRPQCAHSKMRWSLFMGCLGLFHLCPVYGGFCG